MSAIIPVAGHIGGECFLFVSEKSAVLLDAGFAFCADRTAANIRAVLGDRPLDYVLATHTHYDHISGVSGLKRAYPMLRTVGSRHAQEVLASNNAKAVMRSLNASFASDAGFISNGDDIDELSIDIALTDGEELQLRDMTIRAVATPGHTRCAMSYYFPEERLLACSETIGIAPEYPEVIPCMIVGYDSTIDSIERSRRLRPRQVFVSHLGLIPEGEAEQFFSNARQAVEKAVAMLFTMHDRGCGEDEIVDAFTQAFYSPCSELQPERAFILNTRSLIPRLLHERENAPPKTA